MEREPKISIVERIPMAIIVIIADVAEALAVLGIAIPVIGQALPVIAWFYGFTISAIIIFWLTMKGVSVKWFLGGSGIELIPILNGLPLRIAALLATFLEDSLPEKAKAVVGVATGKGALGAVTGKPTK